MEVAAVTLTHRFNPALNQVFVFAGQWSDFNINMDLERTTDNLDQYTVSIHRTRVIKW